MYDRSSANIWHTCAGARERERFFRGVGEVLGPKRTVRLVRDEGRGNGTQEGPVPGPDSREHDLGYKGFVPRDGMPAMQDPKTEMPGTDRYQTPIILPQEPMSRRTPARLPPTIPRKQRDFQNLVITCQKTGRSWRQRPKSTPEPAPYPDEPTEHPQPPETSKSPNFRTSNSQSPGTSKPPEIPDVR